MNGNTENNGFFSREHLKGDLKNRSVRGGFVRAAGNAITALMTLGSTIVLARLLVPAEFGLFAMVFSVTSLARNFGELGLGTATVQRKEVTHEETSALFWINFGIGVALTAIIAAISPVISWFYHDDRLIPICLVLSATFLFSGLTVQHRSLLERHMHFGYMAIVRVIATFISVSIAIAVAIYGLGVWALVWREISFTALYAAGTWIFCRWLPSPFRLGVDVWSSLRIGANVSGFSLIRYLTQSVDQILIGRVYGATPLGLYGKALSLASMPIEQVRGVILPVGLTSLSALQGDADRYRRFYGRLLSILTFIYMPGVVFMAIHSESVVRLILGEQWVASAPYFRIFAIVGFVTPIIASCQLVMVTSGETDKLLKWGVVNGACLIAGFAVGVWWGAIGVAYAYLIVTYSLLVPLLFYAYRDTPINIRLLLSSIALPVMASGSIGVIMVVLLPVVSNKNIFLHITVFFMIAVVSYIGVWLSNSRGRQQLSEFYSYSTELFRKT
jgi:O-antigen/teichoic acid export membrane protein